MSDKRVIFECPACRTAITRPLLALLLNRSISMQDGVPAVPKGFFAVNKAEYWNVSGNVVVNLSDLVGTNRHTDPGRLNGCCGLDGLDGPNLVCANGHEIGTEKSDCWMAHAAILLETVTSHEPA
jgi:hypothetical protein